MTDTKRPTPDLAALLKEALELRAQLEALADSGAFKLADPTHAAAHARLDELERQIYAARRAAQRAALAGGAGAGGARGTS